MYNKVRGLLTCALPPACRTLNGLTELRHNLLAEADGTAETHGVGVFIYDEEDFKGPSVGIDCRALFDGDTTVITWIGTGTKPKSLLITHSNLKVSAQGRGDSAWYYLLGNQASIGKNRIEQIRVQPGSWFDGIPHARMNSVTVYYSINYGLDAVSPTFDYLDPGDSEVDWHWEESKEMSLHIPRGWTLEVYAKDTDTTPAWIYDTSSPRISMWPLGGRRNGWGLGRSKPTHIQYVIVKTPPPAQ